MAEETAALNIRLEATIARFEQQMRKADQVMRRQTRQMETRASRFERTVSQKFARAGGALIGAFAVRASFSGLDHALTTLDEIGKTADKLGLTTDALQELRSAAEQSGVAVGTFDMAMQRFGRRVAEARQGTGEAKAALKELGIDLVDQAGNARDIEDVLADVADRMASMSSQTDKNRIAMKLFDSEGVVMVNMLREGSEGMDAMREKARSMNAVISEESVRAAEALRTEIDVLSNAFSNTFVSAVGKAAQALNELFGIKTGNALVDMERTINRQEKRVKGARLTADVERVNPFSDQEVFERQVAEEQAVLDGLRADLRLLKKVVDRPTIDPVLPSKSDTKKGRGGGGKSREPDEDAALRLTRSIRERIQALREEQTALGLTGVALARYQAEMEAARFVQDLETLAAKEGNVVTGERRAEVQQLAANYVTLAEAVARETEEVEKSADAAKDAARAQKEFFSDVTNSISGAIAGARSLKEALAQVAIELARIAANDLAKGSKGSTLLKILGGVAGSAVGAAAGGFTVSGSAAAGSASFLQTPFTFTPSAKGNAFNAGRLMAFAKGGIVNGPTIFPMARGAGLMGEAGPEAVMPLKRGPGGRLGVEASGGGTVINEVYNIDARGAVEGTAQQIARMIQANNRHEHRRIKAASARARL